MQFDRLARAYDLQSRDSEQQVADLQRLVRDMQKRIRDVGRSIEETYATPPRSTRGALTPMSTPTPASRLISQYGEMEEESPSSRSVARRLTYESPGRESERSVERREESFGRDRDREERSQPAASAERSMALVSTSRPRQREQRVYEEEKSREPSAVWESNAFEVGSKGGRSYRSREPAVSPSRAAARSGIAGSQVGSGGGRSSTSRGIQQEEKGKATMPTPLRELSRAEETVGSDRGPGREGRVSGGATKAIVDYDSQF